MVDGAVDTAAVTVAVNDFGGTVDVGVDTAGGVADLPPNLAFPGIFPMMMLNGFFGLTISLLGLGE